MELKVKFLPSLLQCTAIYVYALQLRAKKKKSFIILQPIKIIFVTLFFFYSFILQRASSQTKHSQLSQLPQTHSLKLSPLYLTAPGPTRSSTSLAHRSLTSPTHQLTHFIKLPSRPKPQAADPHLRPTPLIRR